jgi:DNA-binding beta-propeller fold protein YncE
MKRRTLLLSTLLFILIAAAGIILPAQRTLSLLPGIWSSSRPTEGSATDQASFSKDLGGKIKLLLVTQNGSLQAQPVDPATLAALPDYAPINLGSLYTYAVSSDRKTLAMIIWPSSSAIKGTLHLINLDTWQDTPADLRLDDYVSELTFSADGKMLYWVTSHDPMILMQRDYQVYRYELETDRLSPITQLPSTFVPWSHHLSEGRLALLGIPNDSKGLTTAAPQVLMIDPSKNEIASTLRLDGVKAGQFFEIAQTESGEYVTYRPGLAWDPEGKLLYVTHADDDQVTRVDLNRATIQQTHIHPQHSALDWLLTPSVEAKGGMSSEARAVLNPEGNRLYSFSQRTEWGELTTAHLRVIATDGMREISRLDGLLTDFALTPDGHSLLFAKAENIKPYGFDMQVSRDVYLLDAETLQEQAHVRVDQTDQLDFGGFSPDGRYAYLTGSSAQWVEGSGWRNWHTNWHVLDLTSGHLQTVGESTGGYIALVHILP